MSKTTTDDKLKIHFKQYGKVVKAYVAKDWETGESRGFGFVKFLNLAMVDEALKMEHHIINGCKVKPTRRLSREEQEKRRVFFHVIRDLSEKELREALDTYGEIVKVTIPCDKQTNIQLGFAFIEFADTSSVDEVLSLGSIRIKKIRVNFKKAHARRDTDTRGENRGGSSRGSVGRPGESGTPASFTNRKYDAISSVGYDERFGVYSGGYAEQRPDGYSMPGGYGIPEAYPFFPVVNGLPGYPIITENGTYGVPFFDGFPNFGGYGGFSAGEFSNFGSNYSQGFSGGPKRGKNYFQRSAPYGGE